ncbi:hypothetical protein PVAG01_10812 [Phlyctema vagabunda]|uniref:Uncharacterized protein n=1 Tax=Phlyctema vagabunda TaxID=108571 RepID=A0ABR4P3Z0_9HELO
MKHIAILERLFLTAACFATATTARSSHENIFQRQSTCPESSFKRCPQAGLPANFCCDPDTTCIALAGNTTVLCCPAGQTCATIAPIPCDITAQNATLHPNNALKTTALSGVLAECGNNNLCCPFGYSCGDGACKLNPDQKASPLSSSTSKASSSPTSTRRSTTTSPSSSTTSSRTSLLTTATPSNSPQTNDTCSLPLEKECDKFPAGAVLAGFFPGIAVGILLSVAGICLLGAQRRRAARKSIQSFGNNISEPRPNHDMRSDFLRKPPQTPSTTAAGSTPGRHQSLNRVRSMFRRSGNGAGGLSPVMPPIPLQIHKVQNGSGGGGGAGYMQWPPVTPPLQREPSFENIDIFADGQTASALREREREHSARDGHQTTFGGMMESGGFAGLKKGQRGYSQLLPDPPRR